jgi:hypothetical protein
MMATRRKIHTEGAKRNPRDCSSVYDVFASGDDVKLDPEKQRAAWRIAS